MNTIRATVFLLALALSGGCATVVPDGLDLKCEGAKVRKIKINYKRHGTINVSPSERKVARGEAINYRVKGAKSRAFKAKGTKAPNASASFAWLNASGKGGTDWNGNSHFVCVPDDQELGIYEYVIEIEDVGTLDPTVHVNK
jgi:hypothetical protein